MGVMDVLKQKAKENPKKIVFAEGTEERILKAVDEIQKQGIANCLLLGNVEEVKAKASSLGIDLGNAELIDPANFDKIDELIDSLYNLRKEKLVNRDEAKAILEDYNYFAVMLVKAGIADGMISGSTHSTAQTVRPALQIIKTKSGLKSASGAMIMEKDDRIMIFADIAIIPEPSAEQIAEVAFSTAETAKLMEIEPRVAMLSFSTKGSSVHHSVDKMKEATMLAKAKGVNAEGELQVDAALVKEIANRKCPDCSVKGDANVFIFPDLNSGNIGYKLVEYLGAWEAIGPILQGLQKPINDLSRGCTVEEIIDLAAYTVVEAQQE